MTVSLITRINRYQGLAADDKPADALVGSTFYETDTGLWFVWDGSSWVEYFYPVLDEAAAIAAIRQGLLSQNFERQVAAGASQTVSGRVYQMALPLRAGQVITNIHLQVTTAGADVSTSKVGLYDKDGARLAVSADLGTAWQSTSVQTNALSAPYTVLATDVYYVALIAIASTTQPSFLRGQGSGFVTGGAVGAGVVPFAAESSQTDLDATVAMNQDTPIAFWVGVS